jgi:hypothetical protein
LLARQPEGLAAIGIARRRTAVPAAGQPAGDIAGRVMTRHGSRIGLPNGKFKVPGAAANAISQSNTLLPV